MTRMHTLSDLILGDNSFALVIQALDDGLHSLVNPPFHINWGSTCQ